MADLRFIMDVILKRSSTSAIQQFKPYLVFLQNKKRSFALMGFMTDGRIQNQRKWQDRENHSKLITFSIVTTVGNQMLSRIHNNPKLDGPRMPVILPDELADDWLNTGKSQKELSDLLLPFPDELMHAHSVYRISKKESKGNVPEAEEEYMYPELILG